ncbi:MAG: hypothetical protein P8P74_00010 [Crocinitomicaceae bacterium]|nr:hypothetical protein [Crocinitomicaceae bacterium]
MKALYIVGIVLSFIFLFVIGFFIAEVESARFMSYYDYDPYSYSSYGYNSYTNYGEDETLLGAIVSFFFFAFFILAGILGLIKTKTKTNKVLSIIGLSLSGIFFLWNLLVMVDPGAISYDEVGGGFVFYSLVMMAFMIVGLVQAVRYAKQSSVNPSAVPQQDILDS